MRLGQVVGRVILSQQDPAYKGGRFLMVHPLSRSQLGGAAKLPLPKSSALVVFDSLGAGIGEVVAFSEGAEATAPFESPIPIDAYCCAIVDQVNFKPQHT